MLFPSKESVSLFKALRLLRGAFEFEFIYLISACSSVRSVIRVPPSPRRLAASSALPFHVRHPFLPSVSSLFAWWVCCGSVWGVLLWFLAIVCLKKYYKFTLLSSLFSMWRLQKLLRHPDQWVILMHARLLESVNLLDEGVRQ